ncbi:MAG: hypothetical protein AB1486_07255 [Planctomycetota bacterium]
MSSPVAVDIFVEDRAHAELLVPLLLRVAREEAMGVIPRVRSARGGHGRAMEELKLYQNIMRRGAADASHPDVLIVGIDSNCTTLAKKREMIRNVIEEPFCGRLVVACPDPHVERWYLADPDSFVCVVGSRPAIGRKKCVRDYYKGALAKAVRQAGHPATLGGIEFARELVEGMDLYRAGRNDRSLKAFLDDLRSRLRMLPAEGMCEVQ